MINPKQCKCNPTNNRQMEANEKKSKNLLIINNKTEHVLESFWPLKIDGSCITQQSSPNLFAVTQLQTEWTEMIFK